MKRQWAYSLVASSLLLSAPLTLNAREPKTPNPCRELEKELDDQVNTLHQRQDAELAQCRQSNGKNADVCRAMKNDQKLDLQALRGQRQDEMDRCHGPLSRVINFPTQRQNESCDTYDRNRDRYRYGQGKYPPHKEPPYTEPPKHPPVGHNPPGYEGDGKHHHDQDASATRNAGNSGSGSSHSGGSTSGHSGSSSGSGGGSGSSSYHGSSGSGSSSGGSSYSGHSSSSGSSGGSSYSGSSSSSSSSGSHESGGRPK